VSPTLEFTRPGRAPFEGRSRTVNLSDPALAIPLNFWWYPPPEHRWLVRFLALLLLLAGVAAAARLYVLAFRKPPSRALAVP